MSTYWIMRNTGSFVLLLYMYVYTTAIVPVKLVNGVEMHLRFAWHLCIFCTCRFTRQLLFLLMVLRCILDLHGIVYRFRWNSTPYTSVLHSLLYPYTTCRWNHECDSSRINIAIGFCHVEWENIDVWGPVNQA